MKTFYSSREQIQSYYENSAVDQTLLKSFIGGVDYYRNRKDVSTSPSDSMIIGSAVDAILLHSPEDVKDEVCCSNMSGSISNLEKEILSFLPKREEYVPLFEQKGELLEIFKQKNYYSNRKEETNYHNFISSCSLYYEEMIKNEGKIVLTSSMKETVDKVVHSLKNNKHTAYLFDRCTEGLNDEIYYQYPVYFTYDNIPCKGLLDMVQFNRDSKGNIISIIPIDLKTMSGYTIDFPDHAKKFRYDIQAAFYTQGLIEKFGLEVAIMPFQFVVESTTNPGYPMIYECTNDFLKIGKEGLTTPYRKIPGFEGLLYLYGFHKACPNKYNKIVEDFNGIVPLDYKPLDIYEEH